MILCYSVVARRGRHDISGRETFFAVEIMAKEYSSPVLWSSHETEAEALLECDYQVKEWEGLEAKKPIVSFCGAAFNGFTERSAEVLLAKLKKQLSDYSLKVERFCGWGAAPGRFYVRGVLNS